MKDISEIENKAYPLVSVIVLAYNHSGYVSQCLNSIINQTYPEIEITFIDDGSKDNTFELGVEILKNSKRKFFVQKNNDNGICKNLNLGIKEFATGKYFSMISADDWWEDNNIVKKAAWLEENGEYAMVYSPMKYFYQDKGVAEPMTKQYHEGKVFNDLILDNFITAHSILVKTDILKRVGYFDEKSRIEDWDMWLRIAQEFKIGFINEPLGYYRIHSENFSKNKKIMIENQLYVLNKHRSHDIARQQYEKTNAYYVATYSSIPEALKYMVGNFKWSLFYLKQVVKVILRSLTFQNNRVQEVCK